MDIDGTHAGERRDPFADGEAGHLSGITVVDCTVTIPGPYATALLHRMGARIIKLEPPQGDVTRMFPQLHDALNRGKESVTVDLKDPADLALVRTICSRADVFVEGWRPGVAERLRLGREHLASDNPALVYCSISGYGTDGPLRDRPGHDLNYIAATGMARALFGERPPHALGIPLADLAGGTFAALRILAALLGARTSGRGGFIDVSLAGSVRDWVEAIGGDQTEQPLGPLSDLPHYGVFETADGHHITLGTAHEDHFWRSLCTVLGLEEWAGLNFLERASRSSKLKGEIARVIGEYSREELEKMLNDVDTCWAFVESPAHASAVGGMIARCSESVPSLGEHSSAVRAEFDISRTG